MAGHARPFWGWHQLDKSWARRLVATAGVRPGELVLDVGAGHGCVTEVLLAAGARVVAVELNRHRYQLLRARFAGQPVTVVRADAADLRLPRRPFRVVANPPFAVVTPLVARLLSAGSRLDSAVLVVPRHAARHWTAPGAPGARRWHATYSVSLGATVPRSAFVPPPPHDAKVLVVRRRHGVVNRESWRSPKRDGPPPNLHGPRRGRTDR